MQMAGRRGCGRVSERSLVDDDGDGVEVEVEVSLTREMFNEEAGTFHARFPLLLMITTSILLQSLIEIVLRSGWMRRT
jgi:hypothetical protein